MFEPIPPDYLVDKVVPPTDDGPSVLLADGRWCGHGEPRYHVWDVRLHDADAFEVQLPAVSEQDPMPPAVRLTPPGGAAFLLYDPRRHLASVFACAGACGVDPRFGYRQICPDCGGRRFKVSVGFEVPDEAAVPNDTSWFALAIECTACRRQVIAFEDETA